MVYLIDGPHSPEDFAWRKRGARSHETSVAHTLHRLLVMSERRVEPARTERVERMKVAIRERLEGLCCHFPQHELDLLVERMAILEIKYTLRAEMTLGSYARLTRA
jgi:hypothetical protein